MDYVESSVRADGCSDHLITNMKCQIRRETLGDHGCGIWCGQMSGHMLSLHGRRSAMKSEGELRWGIQL